VYSFTLKDYKTRIFKKRIDALNVIKEAEKNKPKRNFTIEKEE
jgi:hypothetical protein